MSTTPLSLTVQPTARAFGEEEAESLIALLEARMRALHIELQRRIVEGPLSGGSLNVRTGALRRSIQEETARSGDLIVSRVGTDIVYGPIHEFGGIITPKNASALVFEVGGRKVFARMVRMPARPYLGPTYDEMREEIVAGLQEAFYEGMAA